MPNSSVLCREGKNIRGILSGGWNNNGKGRRHKTPQVCEAPSDETTITLFGKIDFCRAADLTDTLRDLLQGVRVNCNGDGHCLGGPARRQPRGMAIMVDHR